MLDCGPHFFAGAARALTDAFTESTHAFTELLTAPQRSAMPHVTAKALSTATGALTRILVSVTDTAVPTAGNVLAGAMSPLGNMKLTPGLVL